MLGTIRDPAAHPAGGEGFNGGQLLQNGRFEGTSTYTKEYGADHKILFTGQHGQTEIRILCHLPVQVFGHVTVNQTVEQPFSGEEFNGIPVLDPPQDEVGIIVNGDPQSGVVNHFDRNIRIQVAYQRQCEEGSEGPAAVAGKNNSARMGKVAAATSRPAERFSGRADIPCFRACHKLGSSWSTSPTNSEPSR